MEENKHINYFKVENFKRFKSFEMNDLGQFNIIVGDNNVGKTSVLEALLIERNTNQYIRNLRGVLFKKGIKTSPAKEVINFIDFFLNKYVVDRKFGFHVGLQGANTTNSFLLEYKEIGDLDNIELKNLRENLISESVPKLCLVSSIDDEKKVFSLNNNENKESTSSYIPFIQAGLGYEEDLIGFYAENIQKSKSVKERFINNLRIFIPDLEDFEISTGSMSNFSMIVLRLKNLDQVFPLAIYGQGAIKLYRYLAEIIKCKNNRLMIDEIDNGIYFRRFRKFWNALLKLADFHGVQIFATTHNIECLEYLNETLKSEEMSNLRYKTKIISLQELPDKSVKAYTYNFEQFEFALDRGHEIRGE